MSLTAKLSPRYLGQKLARLAVPLALAAAAIAGGAAAAHYYTKHHLTDPPVQVVERGPRLWYPVGQYPALTLPDGERRAVKSVLNVRNTMHYGDYVWNEQHIPAGDIWVRIDLARQLLSVFRDGHEIGSAVILYGTDGKPTPTGVFPILEKRETHVSSLYDASMPYMMRLTGDGVAIHASNVRRGAATHGCIGIPPSFAALLFKAVSNGDKVAILPPREKSS
ncbi:MULTISPECIES: L,D-transpeptidase family protein [Sphingomonas]|uniref:L,D-transpeptidase family protein n=1 Tax=Sphingomonas TaxID=13687 RepID=UPI000A4FB6E3|nr:MULTISPECIES: L,D-transpeptidase family protein [Sphingomonas]MCW6531465.1 L,D-transpeptidase family protein [Sphingomonas lycopersici]